MTPLVTIVTISKDDPDGLANSLRSAKAQTFQDYEHIVIRSGGSRQTAVPDDPRIVVYDEEARGISHALNSGVHKARGTWVQFLNGGDCFATPDSLGELVAAADDSLQLVCAFAQVMQRRFTIPRRRLRPGRDSFLYVSHQATLFRRELFTRHGLFSPDSRIHMDLEWLTRLPPETPYVFLDTVAIRFDPFGVSATQVVRSSIEEAGILWRTPLYRYRAVPVLLLLLPFRILRREFRRLF